MRIENKSKRQNKIKQRWRRLFACAKEPGGFVWVEVGEGWGRPEVTFVFALVIIGILERQGFSMVFGLSGPM